jgi:two-component system, chemotaxis family, chemotaxis protein CheY
MRREGIGMGNRILVVDDASVMRAMVRGILSENGFEVVGEASTGTEALELYDALLPDCVTMNITMGGKDGISTAREILSTHADARIVIVSAVGQERALRDSFAAGVKDFVLKPFRPQRLLQAVRKALV